MTKKHKSVIYVNYSPYENSGHILDYLNENFEKVFLFLLAFHPLDGRQKLNKIIYFEKGEIVKERELFYLQVPASMVWIFIPVRSLLNALQMFKEAVNIYRKFGKVEFFFSVNAFAVFVGMLFKKIGLVRKTVFWVWDYYPASYPGITVKFSRWMYWQFDKLATYCDRVVYLNNRLANVRKEQGLIPENSKYPVAPIGMGEILPLKKISKKRIKIGFIGVLKKSQGLDMLIDSANYLEKKFKQISFEIIGSGPDADYFVKKAKRKNAKFNFYGWVTERKFAQILSNCTIGIAPYSPEESNVSRYGDPGKVKRYLEFNLPSIITDVFEFSAELRKSGAGIVVTYGDQEELANAISRIVKNYDLFRKNAQKLHKKYYYKSIYKVMFENKK